MAMMFRSSIAILALLLNAAKVFGHMAGHGHYDHDHRDLIETQRTCGYEEPSEEERAELARIIEQDYMSRIYEGSETIQIDTYFHLLVKSDGEGNASDATVTLQMDILNKAFGGIESEEYGVCSNVIYNSTEHTRTPFVFNLIEVFRWVDDDWFNMGSSASEIKQQSERIGDCSTLNIYSGNPGSILGVATRPRRCEENLKEDGVIIDYNTLPGGETVGFNEGATLIHEVGHWLGLDHTFQNKCDSPGDSVDDTPYQREATSGCPAFADTCRDLPGNDPIHNFMDYSDDCCMYQFTPLQSKRMRNLARIYRSLEGVPPSTAPSTMPTESPDPLVILAESLVEFFGLPPVVIDWAQQWVDFLESLFGPIFSMILGRFR